MTERRPIRSFVLPPITAALALGASGTAQEITPARCAESVLPKEEELAWRSVPWRTRFAAAVIEADERNRPVLLWAMNGHPLGCT